MNDILTFTNAKRAGILTLAAYLAMNLTSSQSTWIRGFATFGAVAVALPFAIKA